MNAITSQLADGLMTTLADPLMAIGDVASALRVGNRTVQHLHRSGQLPGVVVAHKLRWRLSSVESYVANIETQSDRRAVVRRPAGEIQTAMQIPDDRRLG